MAPVTVVGAGSPLWLDIINAASTTVVALAAVFAAYFAARGLSAWRHELIGRRKYELAEEVLLAVRELEEHIAFIRSPVSTASEQAEFKKGPSESDDDFRLRVTYSTALLRYQAKADYFAKLRALGFRAAVVLDENFEQPIKEALLVVDEVLRSAHMAHMYARHFNEQAHRHMAGLPPSKTDWTTKMHEQESIYWGTGGEDDKIAQRVKHAVAKAQELFRPVMKSLD